MFLPNFILIGIFFFFKQKPADEMRISDWSSDVCSSDLDDLDLGVAGTHGREGVAGLADGDVGGVDLPGRPALEVDAEVEVPDEQRPAAQQQQDEGHDGADAPQPGEVDVVVEAGELLEEAHARAPSSARWEAFVRGMPNSALLPWNRLDLTSISVTGRMKKYDATRLNSSHKCASRMPSSVCKK